MKKDVKNVLSNEGRKLSTEKVKARYSHQAQRVFEQNLNSFQLVTNYSMDSQNISAALQEKTVVKDQENNRVLGTGLMFNLN